MLFRCPLCLKQVQADDRFVRYCPQHPARTAELKGSDFMSTPLEELLCPEPDCSSGAVVNTTGLQLKHVDCPHGRSPFAGVAFTTSHDGHTLRHWELLVMEEIQRELSKIPRQPWADLLDGEEMFFPFALLVRKDTFAVSPPASHVLVGVVGEKGVGKTFLTMHLADLQGYGHSALQSPYDFLFCVPDEGSAPHTEFLNTLLIRMLLQGNSDFRSFLRATPERHLNLKAGLFVRESLTTWLRDGDAPQTRQTPAIQGDSPQRPWVAAFRRVLRDFIRVLSPPKSARTTVDWFCSLLMYDIAGETVSAGDSAILDEHQNAMDVMLVVVSAEDLVKTPTKGCSLAKGASLLDALRRWKGRPGSRVALVVTKGDVGPTAIRERGQESDTLEGRRRVLVEVLKKHTSTGAGQLAQMLSVSSSPVEAVFFIRPEFTSAFIPVVHGLSDVVRWCFDPTPTRCGPRPAAGSGTT